jgi:hypothetical protein
LLVVFKMNRPNSTIHFFEILLGIVGIFLFFVFASATIFFQPVYSATPPSIITYQGKLLENGAAVTSTQAIAFLLYDAADAGSLLYTASGTLVATQTISITPTSGMFAIDLGDIAGDPTTNAITSSIFADNASVYLELWIDGTKMTPRKRLTSAPYAVNAEYLMGATGSTASTSKHIVISDDNGNFTFSGSPQTSGVSGGAVYINTVDDADQTLFGIAVGGDERFRVDNEGDTTIAGDLSVSTTFFVDISTGRVGINSTTPEFDLAVNGTSQFTGTSTFSDILQVEGKINDPILKSTYSGAFSAFGTFVQGNYMYVAARTNGLHVIDIADPENPIFVSSTNPSGNFHDVFVSGNYAYAANSASGLRIIDVSNPKQPQSVGLYAAGGSTEGVHVVGNYAYVADNNSDFEIVDVSDPTNPVGVSVVALGGVAYEVFVSGDYAYVISGFGTTDLHVIDVKDPKNPSLITSMDLGTSYGLFVKEPFLYVANGGDGLEILDISDPENPSSITTVDILGTTKDVYVSGDYAYLSNDSGSMHIYDVSVSGTPRLSGALGFGGGNGRKIVVQGNYAYVAAEGGGVRIVDVSGVSISNAEIGTARIGNLLVDSHAQFTNGLQVRNGLHVSNNGLLLGGDFGMYSNNSSVGATNTLHFSDRVLFKTSASSTETNLFIFDTFNDFTTTVSSTYLLSVRNNGNSAFSVASNGDVAASGTLFAANATVGTPGTPGDLAEHVDIAIDDTVEPGDVMMIDPDTLDTYRRSGTAYEQAVAGVISTNPTITVGSGRTGHTAVMAMVGRVPIKISGENGPVKRGDILVTASLPGHAMRYDPTKDNGLQIVGIVGMALESFEGDVGKILGLVRSGWMNNRHQTIAGLQQDLIAVAEAGGVDIQSNADELQVVQNTTGGIGLIDQNVNLNGYYIANVAGLFGKNNAWEIDVNGRFITRVETSEGKTPLYALQSQNTEYMFSGSGVLNQGESTIIFDQVTRDIIDSDQSIKVSITLTAEANGVYVSEKNAVGFTVKELLDGESNATFDWVVIAHRKISTIAEVENIIEPVEDDAQSADEVGVVENNPDVPAAPAVDPPVVDDPSPIVEEEEPTGENPLPAEEEPAVEPADDNAPPAAVEDEQPVVEEPILPDEAPEVVDENPLPAEEPAPAEENNEPVVDEAPIEIVAPPEPEAPVVEEVVVAPVAAELAPAE